VRPETMIKLVNLGKKLIVKVPTQGKGKLNPRWVLDKKLFYVKKKKYNLEGNFPERTAWTDGQKREPSVKSLARKRGARERGTKKLISQERENTARCGNMLIKKANPRGTQREIQKRQSLLPKRGQFHRGSKSRDQRLRRDGRVIKTG